MLFGGACLLLLLSGAQGSGWQWPDGARAASVRIDTKVRFVDDDARRPNKVQADDIKPPVETEGFYNRPSSGAGSGRYAVQSELRAQRLSAQEQEHRQQYSDGTLDSVQVCKCVPTRSAAACHSSSSQKACPSGSNLCCYRRTNRNPHSQLGIFTELEDERPMLLPNKERRPGPFSDPEVISHDIIGATKPSANGGAYRGLLFGPGGPTGNIGPSRQGNRVLVGPSGPSAFREPSNPAVLVGPKGPTGIIGPNYRDSRYQQRPGVLVGPEGPSGMIGPLNEDREFLKPSYVRPNFRNPGVLVGPEGPTGNIGVPEQPYLLVGPGGPTGGIGPDQKQGVHANQGVESAQVLVGPGGPTRMIGVGGRRGRWQTGPGVLVGPGGPTGIIGPGQRLLVGPGGPTGSIGPRGYGQYGYGF